LASAPNNDRSKSVPYRAQQGFINVFALDMFQVYTAFLPGLAPVKEQLDSNLAFLTSQNEGNEGASGTSENEGTIGSRTRSGPRRSQRVK
jgi:hypothetical protein